jgi:DNA-binding transcriptional LysR family regulator
MVMARNLPPLNALRAFEAAGRHESFSRAAEELGVSHSAISKHVRGLEDRLGAQLFRDLSRGVALTSDGARYLATVTPALDAIGEATEYFATTAEGVVAVNSETAFAVKWLMRNIGSFYEQHPNVELDIDATSHLADIARYEAEVAIRFVSSGTPDREALLISDAWVYPYATPKLAEQIGGDARNLLNYRLLRDRPNDPWQIWFEKAGLPEIYTVSPRKRMRAVLAHQAAVDGLGVFLGSAENVAQDVAEGKLVKCFDIGFWMGSYFLMFGDGVLRRKPVRLFRDWLLSETQQFRSGENATA